MPVIRYTLKIEGADYELTETDTFPPTDDPSKLIQDEIVTPLQRNRAKLGEPGIELVRTEVTNPYVHLHPWQETRRDKFTLKVYYECPRCGVTGYTKLNLFTGPYRGVTLDEPYQGIRNEKKFGLCRDPLKQLPKNLIFGLRVTVE